MKLAVSVIAASYGSVPMLADAAGEYSALVNGLGNLGGLGLLSMALFFLLRQQSKDNREDMAKERALRDEQHDEHIKEARDTRHLIRNFWQSLYESGKAGRPTNPPGDQP